MNRAHSRQGSAVRAKDRPVAGCLVVVTAAELSVLDLLLTAARRRLPETTFTFPRRIATRRNGPADAELAATRTLFRQIEQDGGFIATWQAGGHRFGLPDSLRRQLLDGSSAVISAPADIVGDLNELSVDVHTVRLAGGVDAARAALSARACLRRIVGPRQAARLEARNPVMQADALAHDGNIPSAVRVLTEALVRIEREHYPLSAGTASRGGAEARARGTWPRRIAATTAGL